MQKRHLPLQARVHAITTRDWLWKIGFIAILTFCSTLLLLSENDNRGTSELRGGIAQLVLPTIKVLGSPLESVKSAAAHLGDLSRIQGDNDALRAENADLKRWQLLATELQAENANLRQLLAVVPEAASHFVSARVLGDTQGTFSHAATLNAGADNGIVPQMAVLNSQGLVGRVVDASSGHSRVLLLTDVNSRIPVISEKSRERGVTAGRNLPEMDLHYLPENAKLVVGERLLTTGDASLMPAGIPVGVVSAIQPGHVSVTPLVDWARLDYVSLVAPSN